MAVRIALQCSEADAHLILSDDNSAARLLSRPGEAIYNDANGLVEGNNPFQVVWLADERREQYLDAHPRAGPTASTVAAEAPVVFEGNAAGRRGQNHAAQSAACANPSPPSRSAGQGQLRLAGRGDGHQRPDRRAVPPAERQQPADRRPAGRDGSGHADDGGHQPGGPDACRVESAPFYVVDGRQPTRRRGTGWPRCRRCCRGTVRLAGWRDAPGLLTELTAELDRRQKRHERRGAGAVT